MRGSVIAVGNMKGGVGKTASVVALSQAIAADDRANDVLVIDVDAQASASFVIAGDALHTSLIESGKTVDTYLNNFFIAKSKRPLAEFVQSGVSTVSHSGNQLRISLIPSSPNLRGVERGLIHVLTRTGRNMEQIEVAMCVLIGEQLESLRQRYTHILIDCAPGISLLTEASMRVADLVVVPTIPDYLSVLGLNAFRANVWTQMVEVGGKLPSPPRLPRVLISRFKSNVNMQNRMVASLRELAAGKAAEFRVLQAMIPEAQAVPAALERTATDYPLFLSLWGPVAPVLQSAVEEIREALASPR